MKKLKVFKLYYKLLVFSIIISMPYAIVRANYAMIFPLLATLISYLALIISIYGMILRLFIFSKDPNKAFITWRNKRNFDLSIVLGGSCMVWAGLAVYSLNLYYAILVITGLIIFYRLAIRYSNIPTYRKGIDSRKKSKVIYNNNFFFMLVSSCFYFSDMIRDYTVWKQINFRIFPTIIYFLILILITTNLIMFQVRKIKEKRRLEKLANKELNN